MTDLPRVDTPAIDTPAGELRRDDVARYEAFGGEVREARVTQVGWRWVNNRPGFDGLLPDGTTVWGYAHQVTHITPRETIR
jgi:hypothetical protein